MALTEWWHEEVEWDKQSHPHWLKDLATEHPLELEPEWSPPQQVVFDRTDQSAENLEEPKVTKEGRHPADLPYLQHRTTPKLPTPHNDTTSLQRTGFDP